MATPAPAPDDGLRATLRRFAAAARRYLALRLRLIALEGKEAAAQAAKLLVMAVAAAVLLVAGWLLLCACAILLFGQHYGPCGYAWGAGGIAALHFLLAALLLLRVKSASKATFFPLTTEELKLDQAWLDQEKQKNAP